MVLVQNQTCTPVKYKMYKKIYTALSTKFFTKMTEARITERQPIGKR